MPTVGSHDSEPHRDQADTKAGGDLPTVALCLAAASLVAVPEVAMAASREASAVVSSAQPACPLPGSALNTRAAMCHSDAPCNRACSTQTAITSLNLDQADSTGQCRSSDLLLICTDPASISCEEVAVCFESDGGVHEQTVLDEDMQKSMQTNKRMQKLHGLLDVCNVSASLRQLLLADAGAHAYEDDSVAQQLCDLLGKQD